MMCNKQPKNILPLLLLLGFCGLPPFSDSVLAQTDPCADREEVFGFQLENYPIDHQEGVIADLDVIYRLKTKSEIDFSDYPDFMPIREDIQNFIDRYPNETDFWEILNRRLVESLLEKYPQLGSLRIRIKIDALTSNQPISYKNFRRFSSVTLTRPNACPLRE